MDAFRLLGFVLLIALPIASATHDTGCVVGAADPNTYLVIDTVVDLDGNGQSETYFCEERDTGLPPIFMTGFFLGNGTWCYKETNEFEGIQRGGTGLLGDWFPPGCDQDWGPVTNMTDPANPTIHPENLPEGVPCLAIGEDPITDETCGHAFADELIFGGKFIWPPLT